MADSIGSRVRRAWNVFFNKDPTGTYRRDYGEGFYYRPDRPRFSGGNERSIVTAVFNRIAMDAAAIDIRHVRLDEDGEYLSDIKSSLNECLTLQANLDQTARAFKQDAVMSMLDEGCVAIVPVDTDRDPEDGSFDVCSMRTGKVLEWHPMYVKVSVYNERTGRKEEVTLRKDTLSIVENPLYAVVNERNSTMQRLIRKLAFLDNIDEMASSGKLDMIIQLPYVVKSPARKAQAEERRKAIEDQMKGSQYGIAYIDGTEKVTQLNRPLENNLLKQVEYLTSQFLSQLGFTQGILDGTADESTMNNYYNRIIEPIVAAIADGMKVRFLTKTARSQGQSIEYFRDPFKLIPASQIAEISDKLRRNEIMDSNEIRQKIGLKPSDDPRASTLANPNLNKSKEEAQDILGNNEATEDSS